MKVPILDLTKQYSSIKKEIDAAIQGVVNSQHFILGKEVEGLEKEIAEYCNVKYAIGVASGTDALILSLKALGIGPGDEVITTPFTFIATAEAVSIIGAKPVFVDIDQKTYTINSALVEEKITKKTKAIIPVHLYGQCADMDSILEIANRYSLKVVEDTAQAMGAVYKGKKAGSIGDTGALSFFPSKNLGGFGDGGMVITNDKILADKIRMMRVHGSSIRYIHSVIGTNSRLDALQAAILRVKLIYLDKWLEERRKIAQYYNESLKDLPITTPYTPSYNVHTYHLYVLRVKSDLEKLIKILTEGGIEARTYYPVPLHLQECYKNLNYKKEEFAESVSAAAQTVAVPLFPELEKHDQDYIIKAVKNFFVNKR